jgi:tetratricopeptide (TPR) repeat protein
MFFPRLRQHTKWMFVFLALVFGLGFVLFGIGAGGTGLGDLLRDGGGGGSGDAPSVKDARERTQENPKDAQAWLELSNALQTDGKADESIEPLERYTQLAPKDTDALRTLAGLYLSRANRLQGEAQLAQLDAASLTGGALFTEPLQLGKGATLGTDPVTQAVEEESNRVVTAAITKANAATGKALATYRRLEDALPNDPSVQVELGQAALNAGDATTAIAAFEKFLKLAPDDPQVPLVKEQIKQIKQQLVAQSGAAASG